MSVRKDRIIIIDNLVMFLSAGMSIGLALTALREEMSTPKMQKIVDAINKEITAGSPLWRALEHTGIFSGYMVSMIRIGEESGKLTDNLKVIVTQQQREHRLKSKIRSAVLYPVIVLGITVIVAIGVSWFTLPRLAVVFSQLNVELPLITKILIGIGVFLSNYGFIAVPVFVVLMLAVIYFVFLYSKTKHIGEAVLFAAPGVHTLLQEVEFARFGYIMGTLLSAGLPVVRSLESLRDATTFVRYKELYNFLGERIREGETFKHCLESYPKMKKLIPVSVRYMLSSAEQSGWLEEAFDRIGSTFDEKTETTLKDLTVALEPILLIIIWVGVVGVALAVILPIYSLLGGINP